MNEFITTIVLGLVEGITEFLPISSTGHLILAGKLMNFEGANANTFEIFIQLGAILAVVVLYHYRFTDLFRDWKSGWNQTGFVGIRGISLLAVTTFPALVMGYLFHKIIKLYLFGPLTVAIALAVGGVAILLVEHYKPEPSISEMDNLTYRQALFVGLFQCFALWPGFSRSAATLMGGLLSGVDRKTAAEYSFLAAVPIMVVATLYDLYKEWNGLTSADLQGLAIGFVFSFLSAILAVKIFVGLLQKYTLRPFAYYRVVLAVVVFYFVLFN